MLSLHLSRMIISNTFIIKEKAVDWMYIVLSKATLNLFNLEPLFMTAINR